MSAINLEVVFEGQAVESGIMDARLLAESLAGYSEVFTRANEIINGEASSAVVFVRSDFKRGSFIADLQFVQNISETATQLITAHKFLSAGSLAAVIGFVWNHKDDVKESLTNLYKWLKGEKPDKATRVGESFELTFGQNKKVVNNFVFNLYEDRAIRQGLARVIEPLRHAEIERISVRQDGEEQTSFEKPETTFFDVDPLELESDSSPMEGERDTVLVVSKLSFNEGTTWTFFERGATVVAKIQDQSFWKQIHEHNLTFGEGDRLKVKLVWKMEKKKDKLTQKNLIVKVNEVLPNLKQMTLDGRTG